MSELVVLGLKLGFLALLWLFILFTGNVIRTDIFGRRVPAAELARAAVTAGGVKLSRRELKRLPTTITVTAGAQAGLKLPLGAGVLIGRAPECQLVLEDDYTSARHARITSTPTGYQVEDLGSTNGTYLNDLRLTTPVPIGPQDVLRIGRTQMSLEK